MTESPRSRNDCRALAARLLPALLILTTALLSIPSCLLGAGPSDRSEPRPGDDTTDQSIDIAHESSDDAIVIRLGVQPLYLPTSLITETMRRDAVLHAHLAGRGMEIRLHACLKGDDVNRLIAQGKLDGGIGGDMPAITAAATFEMLIPALIQQGFTTIVAMHHMMVDELRGQRVGYAFGSNAHYCLIRALANHGLGEDDVHLVALEAPQMPPALERGDIIAFAAWEPTPALTLSRHPEYAAIHRGLSSGYFYFLASFSAAQPEAVRLLLAAEVRAMRWLQRRRANLLLASGWALQAMEELTGQELGLTAEEIAALAVQDILGVASVPLIPRHDLEPGGPLHREFEFLKSLDKIPPSTGWNRIRDSFDRSMLTEVLGRPRQYELDRWDYSRTGEDHD